MTNYETIIGLEIHAELATKSKLFCSCPNDPFAAPEPNIYICPICLGLPGTLPVMNAQAVQWSVLVGLALGCEIGWSNTGDSDLAATSPLTAHLKPVTYSKWDRKNYFYPDLPKGYQISQYDLPIDHNGSLMVGDRAIAITRIHLEEDTGKIIHEGNRSLLDFNRAGVPLLELVTEPEIRSGAQAAQFAWLYQDSLRRLGVASADMEKGELRVEANISVRPVGTTVLGTKVEVKNLNSLKSVERAIAFETDRQIAVLARGEEVIQETRGWDEGLGRSFRQRLKETSAEYRYFPEADLPELSEIGLGILEMQRLLSTKELAWQAKARYAKNLPVLQSVTDRLLADHHRQAYFEASYTALPQGSDRDCSAVLLANWIVNDLPDLKIEPASLAELAHLVTSGELTTKLAKELLVKLASTDLSVRAILEAEDLKVVRDRPSIQALLKEILVLEPQAVADFRAGKIQAMGFLVGKAMAKTRGQADPAVVQRELLDLLKEE